MIGDADVVGQVAGNRGAGCGAQGLELGSVERRLEEVAFDDGHVRDGSVRSSAARSRSISNAEDRLRARGEGAGQRAAAGPDLDERLVRLRVDRANDLVDPRRLEKVLAEAFASRAWHEHLAPDSAPAGLVASPRQYFSSISSISSSLIPK